METCNACCIIKKQVVRADTSEILRVITLAILTENTILGCDIPITRQFTRDALGTIEFRPFRWAVNALFFVNVVYLIIRAA